MEIFQEGDFDEILYKKKSEMNKILIPEIRETQKGFQYFKLWFLSREGKGHKGKNWKFGRKI